MTIAWIFAEPVPHESVPVTLVKQPVFAAVVLSVYLYLVLYRGPKWMETRKAFNLRPFMLAYNLAQVVISAYIVYFCAAMIIKQSGSLLSCIIGGEHTLQAHYLLMFSKYSEFIETFIFVLRKKQSQVSFLHVYHHCIVIIMPTLSVWIEPGGPPIMYGILNGFVHVLMYIYYFLTILQPDSRDYYARFKPRITEIQLTQFVIMTVHFLRNVLGTCPGSQFMAYLSVFQNVVLITLFSQFYIKTYWTKKAASKLK